MRSVGFLSGDLMNPSAHPAEEGQLPRRRTVVRIKSSCALLFPAAAWQACLAVPTPRGGVVAPELGRQRDLSQ